MQVRKKRAEFPSLGTILSRRYIARKIPSDRTYQAKVVSVNHDTGRVAVELDGKIFASLSGAAKSITGYPVDGWIFWGLEPQRKGYRRGQ
jgi:hypothetical protein